MVVSNKSNRTNSRWLQVCALLGAMVVLPLGLASAQEDERGSSGGKIRTRVVEALVANGISPEQVQDVIGILRLIMNEIESEGDAFALNRRIHRRLAGLGLAPEQIRAVVRIARRLGAVRSQPAQQKQRIVETGVRTGIQAFVEAGAITPENARARIAAYRQSVARRQQATEQEPALANAVARIRAAVADGTVTPQEGRAKLATYRARLAQRTKAQAPADAQTAAVAARIRAAVAAGTITPEEGRARMAAYRAQLARRQAAASEEPDSALETDIASAVESALSAFVESGQIDAADAEAGLAAYREGVARGAGTNNLRAKYQAAVTRVRAAVGNGTMTPEEGRAKLAVYRERLSQAAE